MMQGVAEVMKQSGEYDRQEAKAVVVYIRMMLKLISEEEALKELKDLGFMTGEEAHHDNNKGGNGMPQLGKYLPRL